MSCCDESMAEGSPLMDAKVVKVVLFGKVAVVTSLTTAGCSVVYSSVVIA